MAAARITELAIAALPATATAADRADCTLQVYEGDITSPVDLQSIFDDYAQVGGIWGVIHLAALKAVGDSALFPLAYYSCNVAATVNLLEVRFALLSSSFISRDLVLVVAPFELRER